LDLTATPDLGQICIQVQLQRVQALDVSALRQECNAIARTTEGIRGIGFTEGEDEGPYLNIVFATEDPSSSWETLRALLLESARFGDDLKGSCICMCTGQDGWNDYLLLHHFDPEVPLDADNG
jgi:hypothetical protein